MIIKEIPVNQQPREKARKYGINFLSNRELLSLILKNGYKGCNVLELSEKVLYQTKGFIGLSKVEYNDLIKIKGISETKALEICAIFEICHRFMNESIETTKPISSPLDIVEWLENKIGLLQQEHFMVIYLNTKNVIVETDTVYVGGINNVNVHPREIFKKAVSLSCSRIILAHNHPSQDITPSVEDIKTTQRLIEIGKLMDIPVIDHIIVAHHKYFSFKNEGMI